MTLEAAPESRDLVGDVQRFGLFSAATVVARYAEIVDRAIAGDPVAPGWPEPPKETAPQVTAAVVRLLESVAALLGPGAGPGTPAEPLVLPPVGPGRTAEGSLWVHNTTPSPAAHVELRVTALVSSDGHDIAADVVSLAPDRVDVLPAGTSREVRLRVRVPAAQPAARYHGLVLNSAAPADALAVLLDVCTPEGARR